MTSIAIALEVNDKGSVVVKRFTDKTVSSVKQMSSRSIGYVQKLSARFTKGLGGAIKMVSGALLNLKTFAIGALAAWGIQRLISDFINLANVQEAAERKLESVLKSTGHAAGYSIEQLKKMASSMQNVTTVGDEVILNGMAIMATFKQIKGTQFELATKAALDMSHVMGTDLKSSIIMIGKALNDPVANLSAMTRAGVQFTESQKTMIKAMWKTGDAAGAQGIILKELESQFGGAAAAARDIFGGAVTAAKNALGDLKETLGQAVTKNDFFISAAKNAEVFFKNLNTSLKANSGKLQEMVTSVGVYAVNMAAKIIEAIGSIPRVFYTIVQAVSLTTQALAALGTVAVNVVALITATANPYWAIKVAIKGYRETFPVLAEMRDSLDRLGVGSAIAATKAENAKTKFSAFGQTAQDLAGKVRELSREFQKGFAVDEPQDKVVWQDVVSKKLIESETKQIQSLGRIAQAEEVSSQKMIASWKTKTAVIDGIWTQWQEKAMVPVESTVTMKDEVTTKLQKIKTEAGATHWVIVKVKDETSSPLKQIEAQAKSTQKTIEKSPTISIDDRATSVLKLIQAEMAKIKNKTVYVKVVHTGTGSTEKPLTEKINEILGLYGELPEQTSMNADFTQVTAGLLDLMQISSRLSSLQRTVQYNMETWHVNPSQGDKTEGRQLQTLFDLGVAGLSGGSGGGSITIEELNINVPNATPQTAEDWRFIVREHIAPELERIS